MNIYLSHRKEGNFQNELYLPLKNSDLGQKNNLILPHEKSDKPFDVKRALEQGKIDVVIAEVSAAATGQGIELGWAYMYKVPIICVYRKGAKVSGSLKILTDQFYEYENIEGVIGKLQSLLNAFS